MTNIYINTCLIFILILFRVVPLFAAYPVIVDKNFSQQDITNHLEYAKNVNSSLRIDNIRDKSVSWQDNTKTSISFGFINEPCWFRFTIHNKGSEPVSESAEQKVAAVMDFIKENFDADISREGMAAAVGLSADHLSRVFNKVTGKKIPDYINALRIAKAQCLLRESTTSITDIAYAVGFGTVKNFNRVFKLVTGTTPGEYRGMAN